MPRIRIYSVRHKPLSFNISIKCYPPHGTVPPRGVGTVLVAACPMLLLTNTVSGAGACFTSSRLNFASNATLLRFYLDA